MLQCQALLPDCIYIHNVLRTFNSFFEGIFKLFKKSTKSHFNSMFRAFLYSFT